MFTGSAETPAPLRKGCGRRAGYRSQKGVSEAGVVSQLAQGSRRVRVFDERGMMICSTNRSRDLTTVSGPKRVVE